jgi:hypothetical protein
VVWKHGYEAQDFDVTVFYSYNLFLKIDYILHNYTSMREEHELSMFEKC